MDITEAEESESRLEEALDDLFELIDNYNPWGAEGHFAQQEVLNAIEKITFQQFIIRGN